jgi:membrane protease YdiL (CAAX protease family)
VSAVLAAPLFEEFIFRVLLQGWLERVEDRRLGFLATERVTVPVEDYPDQAPLEVIETADPAAEELPLMRPRHGWLAVLPHGWTPILISSVMFGLAHIGHGVAPVPLVFFGIVLGYLYQRTHRIVPCIVAHMLFNAYSMLLIWLSLESST